MPLPPAAAKETLVKNSLRVVKPILIVAISVALAAAAYVTRGSWLPGGANEKPGDTADTPTETDAPVTKVIVGDQAQENLGLKAKPVKAETFWKTITVPGMVVDRPGVSDRGVVAPATGVVAKVHHFPGDTVRPGDALFTLKLLSEALHLTQTELFKATQDITLAQAQLKLLRASAGAVPEARITEAANQITRLEVTVKAYTQDLLSRGFGPEQIKAVADGTFVREVTVAVPPRPAAPPADSVGPGPAEPPPFEVQELKVDLGQQVQAGQTLGLLANHQSLAVEGRAFRDETPLLERSVRENWPVEIDFQEDAPDWPAVGQAFHIRYLSNAIDPVNRTFGFRVPLENQSRAVEQEGRTQTLWRFRPGQKVRVLVRVARLDDVFVLPADAVTREGPEAFVFTQNVNTFERKPVRVLHLDGQRVVIANDGSVRPGTFIVQSAAAQLNRLVKAGGGGGAPKGYHIHADGSLHKNEDEGK